jgi:hypothetical protein
MAISLAPAALIVRVTTCTPGGTRTATCLSPRSVKSPSWPSISLRAARQAGPPGSGSTDSAIAFNCMRSSTVSP